MLHFKIFVSNACKIVVDILNISTCVPTGELKVVHSLRCFQMFSLIRIVESCVPTTICS